MRRPPPGWAPAARDAAALLEPFSIRNTWAALLLLSPPIWMLFFAARLTRAAVVLTQPPPGGQGARHAAGVRVAAAGFWGAAGGLLAMLALTPVGQPWFVAFSAMHLLWLVWMAALWGFLGRLSRPGSALRQQVARTGAVWLPALAALAAASMVLPDLVWSLNVPSPPPWMAVALFGYGAGLLAQALLLPHTVVSLLEAFWTAGDAHLALENIHAVLGERLGIPIQIDGWGLHGAASDGGREVSFRLELARAPGQLVVSVRDLRLPPALAIMGRGEDDGAERVSLSDPLLDSALSVSGVSAGEAARLLAGRHDLVMPIFHAHPRSMLYRQRLRVVIPGPPFQGCGGSPVEIASYVADQVEGAVALVSLICARYASDPVPRQPLRHRETP